MKISERAAASVIRPPVPIEVEGRLCPTCAQPIPAKRNRERHALFFAVLSAAFYQWPETPDENGEVFTPHDTEDLRYHVLCKVGWCKTHLIEMIPGNRRQNVAALSAFVIAHRDERGAQFRVHDKGVLAAIPKSIAFNKCGEEKFRLILDKSVEYIESRLGVTIDQLRRNPPI